MPKQYGPIGFTETIESPPDSGVYYEGIVERNYYIDLVKNTAKVDSSQVVNSVQISNSFSIVADAYANANFHTMRYVTFNGVRWKVDSVDASTPPRLIISAGSVYTETEPNT